jgi:hypothetical protein
MDQLLQLRGVTYEWKAPEEPSRKTGTQVGFIAQEVEKVFPKWVDEDSKGFKAIVMPPMQLAALEVESIRTLKAENDELRKRVDALESGRQPRMAGINLNGVGLGVGGLALAGAVVFSRRKKPETEGA